MYSLPFCAAVRLSIVGNDNPEVKVYSGQSMKMHCTAVNVPTGISVSGYHWTLASRDISSIQGVELQDSRNKTLAILSLSYIHHLGDYQCRMTLSTGDQFHSNVVILTPSKFAQSSKLL